MAEVEPMAQPGSTADNPVWKASVLVFMHGPIPANLTS